MTLIKTPKDFEVDECVTQYYYRSDTKSWFWHCLTCDTGSGKRHKHLYGHKAQGDANVATKYHRNAKRLERQVALWRAWWWKEIMTTTDLEYFEQLWNNHWGVSLRDCDPSDVMASVQSDNHLWEYMKKLNS